MRTLAEWLEYQQNVHPREVELGLQRVGEVWRRLGAPDPAPVVITIGGTNGKGSTVALLEAMLVADGKRVGCYTSPHLLRYNERIRVLGADVDDAHLVDAFEQIEAARKDIALTYFEFGTLAALWIFAHRELDVAVLEVGLGGRLDAVNIIDADACIVTTVDLDHMDWLGSDRDSIGREKAGIFRPGRPAIVGMRNPPRGLIAEAERIGAQLHVLGREFSIASQIDTWRWQT
ncbi:MAG: Mur ligase family protein, partial [Rudaea sp.]